MITSVIIKQFMTQTIAPAPGKQPSNAMFRLAATSRPILV
jgi:hypothetical protein